MLSFQMELNMELMGPIYTEDFTDSPTESPYVSYDIPHNWWSRVGQTLD